AGGLPLDQRFVDVERGTPRQAQPPAIVDAEDAHDDRVPRLDAEILAVRARGPLVHLVARDHALDDLVEADEDAEVAHRGHAATVVAAAPDDAAGASDHADRLAHRGRVRAVDAHDAVVVDVDARAGRLRDRLDRLAARP